ncbi:DedA family protein [Acidocella sp.]|uniref:DedA family protein n=1 Tax=Acidocella sp. TaxID=50710 RepID=UPI0026152012|nr:VTT domain-containing protein [Acidocella sp.]
MLLAGLIPSFTSLLADAGASWPLQAAIIIGGTFILEDAATLLAAMQVASGALSVELALAALYAGIVLGDIGLYGLGRLSATNAWARRLVPAQRRDLGHKWVRQRVFPIVVVSRFIPGLRLPTYTTLGFLHAPLGQFALAAIAATFVWTTALFFVSLKLGVLMMHYLGIWRWAGLGVFLLMIIAVGRLAARAYNKRTKP